MAIKITGVTISGNGGSGIQIGGMDVKCPKCGSTDVSMSGTVVRAGQIKSHGTIKCLKCGHVETGDTPTP